MSAEAITCSLARLALCKAIKTPDADELGAEPWNKSVIFHQSHIRQDMRDSIQSPDHRRSRNSFQANRPPKLQRPRSDERKVPVVIAPVPSVSAPQPPKKIPSADRTSFETANQSGATKARRYVPSDDEDEDDNNNDDGHDTTSDDDSAVLNLPITPKPSNPHVSIVVKPASRAIPQPSDDEDEAEEDGEEDEDEEGDSHRGDDNKNGEDIKGRKPFTRPLSDQDRREPSSRPATLPKVRQGSLHNRSRSTGDMDRLMPLRQANAASGSFGPGQEEPIEQWRKSVLHAAEPRSGPGANARTSQLTDSDGSNHSVAEGPSHDGTFSTPAAYQQRPPSMGDMNMMFYQMHQQQQWQLQLQAQQQAQIQQYQARQSTGMHLQAPTSQHTRRSPNRQSMSGMDLLIQRENEKAEAVRKPKRVDPSKASIDGMLGRLPEPGTHNINFQTGNIPRNRASTTNAANARTSQAQRSRSPAPKAALHPEGQHRKMSSIDARRRAEMMRNDVHSPVPIPSASSPAFGQVPMASPPIYGPYLPPAMGMMNMGMGSSLGMQAMPPNNTNRRPTSMMMSNQRNRF